MNPLHIVKQTLHNTAHDGLAKPFLSVILKMLDSVSFTFIDAILIFARVTIAQIEGRRMHPIGGAATATTSISALNVHR